jgi:hypothetical protein
MVSIVGLIELGVLVLANTALAAVATRLFRNRMNTAWGSATYAVLGGGFILLMSTLVLSGIFGIGGNVGTRYNAVLLTIAMPLLLGITIDYFWMPSPDDVELPESLDSSRN